MLSDTHSQNLKSASCDRGIVKFEPNRVWRTYLGGKVLDQLAGKEKAEDSHFPEDWIGSVTEAKNPGRECEGEGLSHTVTESGDRRVFRDLLREDPGYFIGEAASEKDLDRLPLVKYLDSAIRLHFQVHPTAEFARARLNANRGKTEAYVILAVREEVEAPYIYVGFQRPPTRDQLRQWILDQDISAIESCFTPIPVKPGDVFIIPGGTPHALGEGILMLEIMEASDLAVRFEFERGGFVIPEAARFMGRDLETALDVFNLDPVEDTDIDTTVRCEPKVLENFGEAGHFEALISNAQTSCFAVHRSVVRGPIEKELKLGCICVVAEGSGSVSAHGVRTELNQWDRFFCPAGAEKMMYDSNSEMTVLECYPGSN